MHLCALHTALPPEIIFLNTIWTFIANVEAVARETHIRNVTENGHGKRGANFTLSAVSTDCSCREWLMYIRVLTFTRVSADAEHRPKQILTMSECTG